MAEATIAENTRDRSPVIGGNTPHASSSDGVFPPPTPPATAQTLLKDRRRRVKAAASVLAKHRAELYRVVILDRPGARKFVVGSCGELDVDAHEELARLLGTSAQLLKIEVLSVEEYEALFAEAYLSGDSLQMQEEIASARTGAQWSPTGATAPQQSTYNAASERDGVEDLTNMEEYYNNIKRPPHELTTLEFVRLILWEFIRAKGTDLHSEIGSSSGRIRFRADGVLFVRWSDIPKEKMRQINSSLCAMSRLAPADMQFKPLNSVIKLLVLKMGQPTEVELRFASTPAAPLPEVVLRSQSDVIDKLDKVGLLSVQYPQVLQALDEPQGIFLVTGPVGSGKTNTLLGCCSYLQGPDRKIMESGDPIEVYSDERTQIPITKECGWMEAFYSKLRMNPDSLYLGELRSFETVSVALEAALTGHLVLSTFHTINVATTFTRLFKMGIPRDLLADGLNAILSQRLVRVLCVECRKVDEKRTAAMLNSAQIGSGLRIYEPNGCAECFGQGFKGRTAISEFLGMTDDIRDNIIGGMDSKEIVARAVKDRWMYSMQQVARFKIFQGTTSFKEVHRVMKLAVEEVMTDYAAPNGNAHQNAQVVQAAEEREIMLEA